jgi:hypothetical protein
MGTYGNTKRLLAGLSSPPDIRATAATAFQTKAPG